MEYIKSHYPNAQSVSDLESHIQKELNNVNFDLKKTTWGTSLCSDEMTNSFNMFSPLFVGPGPFRFGGISGMPFTGKTGVLAFASHIPTNGYAFIIYGPHVGISSKGVIGEIMRESQDFKTTCCGSLVSGLGAIQSDFEKTPVDLTDPQQNRVKQILFEQRERIFDAEDPIKEVTEIAYQKIHDKLREIISLSEKAFANTKVFLMGGIVINTNWDQEDYFEVRDTELIDFM